MSHEKDFRQAILKGLHLLSKDIYGPGYSAISIIAKLKFFDVNISPSDMSKLKKKLMENEKVAPRRLKEISEGLGKIIESELQTIFDPTVSKYVKTSNPTEESSLIPVPETKAPILPFIYHDRGRLVTLQKTKYIKSSTKEVIELGAKIEQFKNYFTTRADYEYKDYILKLLEKGVDMKYFMLEPNSPAAKVYFQERAKADKDELAALNQLPKILDMLVEIAKEMKAYNFKGNFEIHTYNIIPYNHFLSIDRRLSNAKMVISHYVYGLKRAKSPVVSFTKKQNKGLYNRYLLSLEAYLKQSKKIY